MAASSPAGRLVDAARRVGVTDARVLDVMGRVARAGFVPPEHVGSADDDRPIPIPHAQVTAQPSLSARMVEALRLTGNEHVLEVGTGYGYQTALLAHLARFVTSVERWPDLAARARRNLDRFGLANIRVVDGDGTTGVPESAPYDAVLVSAAFPEVPPPLVEQLREGGRLVQPIGPGGAEAVTLFVRERDGLTEQQRLTPASFVRLYGRHGWPD